MIKKEQYIGRGLDQDTAPDKRQPDIYWDAENIRIVNNGRNLSIKPVNQDLLWVTLDTPGVQRFLVGSIEVNQVLYIFFTDNESAPNGSSTDDIYSLTLDGVLTKILTGNYYLSLLNKIEGVGNYETEDIVKLYWTDGYNQLRVLNVAGVLTTNMNLDLIEDLNLDQPECELMTGGSLIAGKIQYGYTLFKLNGQETKVSPLSKLVSISNRGADGLGGITAEVMNLSVEVEILGVDSDYDFIRLFSIHYQELNQTPKITLIVEQGIEALDGGEGVHKGLTFRDDGNSFIAEYGLDQFTFLGGFPIYPETIISKENRLFAANYKTTSFDIPNTVDTDCRIFSHTSGSVLAVKTIEDVTNIYATPADVPLTHDAINPDYDVYNRTSDGISVGAEGTNFKLSFIADITRLSQDSSGEEKLSLKQNEIYRIGVIFYNAYGQKSPVKWMADIRTPRYATTAYLIGVGIELKAGRASYFTGAVNYRPVIVKRNSWDRTIIAQGFIVPGVKYGTASPYYYPYYIAKDIQSTTSLEAGNIDNDYQPGVDWGVHGDWVKPIKHDEIQFFYSSDTEFEPYIDSTTKIRIVGTAPIISENNRVTKILNNIPGRNYLDTTYFKPYGFSLLTEMEPAFPDSILTESSYAAGSDIIKYENISNRFYSPCQVFISAATVITLEESSKLLGSGEVKSLTSSIVLSNYAFLNNILKDPTAEPENNGGFAAQYSAAVVLKFSTDTWHTTGSYPYDRFIDRSGALTFTRNLPIIELVRDIVNQYGGGSYEAKQRNVYLEKGDLMPMSITFKVHFLGDIYLGYLSVNRTNGGFDNSDRIWNLTEFIGAGVLENNHNVYSRKDETYEHSSLLKSGLDYRNFTIADNTKLLSAYNQEETLVINTPKDVTFQEVEEYSNRIITTEPKQPGEVIDSWTHFLVNEILDVDGIYGAITKLFMFKAEILVFQSSAIGVLAVSPRVQTTGNDGVGIYLGTGNVLHDHNYITTESGTNSKFTIVKSDERLIYYDDVYKSLNELSGKQFSDVLGIRAILQGNVVINCIFDRKHNEFLFNFNTFSLAFNIDSKRVFSKQSFNENITLIPFGDNLLNVVTNEVSTAPYINRAYRSIDPKESSITYLFNPDPTFEKVFHNLEYRLTGTEFSSIEVKSNINDSGTVVPIPKVKFDIHRLHIPRITGTRERFRGIYITVKLSNVGSYSLDDLVLMYNLKG